MTSTIALVSFLSLSWVGGPPVHKHSSNPPAFIFGEWRISELKEVGGHAGETPERAQREIGKRLVLSSRRLNHDNNFLFFNDGGCAKVYVLEVHRFREYDVDLSKGTLWFYGLEALRRNQSHQVIVLCRGRPAYGIEIANAGRLAIYYDGWFFFLEKTSPSTKK